MARRIELDLVRIAACLMVVVMHAPMPRPDADGLFLSALSYLTAPCIGLFLMVSGALLLPVRTDTRTFLRTRLGKVAIPTLVWSLFYLGCSVVRGELDPGPELVRAVCSVPFGPQGSGVLWFMYMLAGLYLAAPILSRWLARAGRREVEFYLLLWVLTLCYPLLELVVEIRQGDTGMLYYMAGYGGYFLLGYYLTTWPEALPTRAVVPLAVAALAVPAACKLGHCAVDFYRLFWYLSIFVAVLCVAWFRALVGVAASRWGGALLGRMRSGVVLLSNLSFGIYLVHIFVLRYVLWHCDSIRAIRSGAVQTLVAAALAFGISAGICWLLSRTPPRLAEWTVGWGRKKIDR